MEEPIAKTTWIQTQKVWKVFWMRAEFKWHSYEPKPNVERIEQFLKLVEEDEFACFWG